MTEAITHYTTLTDSIASIAPDLTELEQLNLKVAAIAGWTEIRHWDTSRNQETQPKKKVYVGKNDRKELGVFIPDYTRDLNAIADVFRTQNLFYQLAWMSRSKTARAHDIDGIETIAETEAIALCKLLLRIHG